MEAAATTRGSFDRGLLLERERELASLAGLIERASSRQACVGLVEGVAGIGKTRLLGEARALATEEGMNVLSARGGELEREFPYGVVDQLFSAVVREASGESTLFAGAAEPARGVFEATSGRSGEGSFAILHGLYWLTVNVASERPLLLSIDDLHWCDLPSLRYLAYLTRRLEGLPLLVLCGLRPAEPGLDAALLAEIANDPLTTTVSPGPLGADAVGSLVRELLGTGPDDAFAAACHAATGGNPLLLSELLKAVESERVAPTAMNAALVEEIGPRAASRAVLIRLARLPEEAGKVARSLSVLGEADLWSVAALAGLDEERAATATGSLARAEIIKDASPLQFAHPLVRGAVYHDLPPGERLLQHRRAAELLAPNAPPEQVAAQLLAVPGSGQDWAVDALRKAAAEALAKGAPESAVAYLRRALEEPPKPEQRRDLLLELGRAEGFTDGAAAAAHLLEAYESAAEPAERAEVVAPLVTWLGFTGRTKEADAIAREAFQSLGPESGDERWRVEATRLTMAQFDRNAVSLDDPAFARYRGELVGPGMGARALAATSSFQWAITGGSADECCRLALRAIEDRTLIRAPNVPTMGAPILLVLAEHPRAGEITDAVLEAAHHSGSAFDAAGGYLYRGLSLLLQGSLAEAEHDLARAAELAQDWGSAGTLAWPLSFMAEAKLERGDLQAAQAALDAAGVPDDPPATAHVAFWYASRLRLHVADGAFEQALELAAECEAKFDGVVQNPAWLPWRSLRAEALHALGNAGDARADATKEVELARRWGAPRPLGRALRVLGTVSRSAGRAALEEAVDVLENSRARLELAKALGAYGATMRLDRRPTDAREPLRRALELADLCGATPLVEHLRTELYATGARPRTTALRGVESLTPSELRVASLAAEGKSNKEIAQALFVTPKTVEVHLSNSYRKLSIASRRELPAALSSG